MRPADAVVASGWRCYSYSWFVGRSDALVAALQEHCRTVTAAYKYPREIEFTDELPKTISGKIRRVEVRERELDRGG